MGAGIEYISDKGRRGLRREVARHPYVLGVGEGWVERGGEGRRGVVGLARNTTYRCGTNELEAMEERRGEERALVR